MSELVPVRDQAISAIATLNEGPLHAALKAWYARPGDRIEVPVEGRQIDIVRGPQLIEIQTGSFAKLKAKIGFLIDKHPLRLVYPIAREKWIVRYDDQSRVLGRRKSPKRGRLEEVFNELVSLPGLLTRPNFSLEILFTQEEEHRRPGPRRRRKRSVSERRLIAVLERRYIHDTGDLQRLLPLAFSTPFTTKELAQELGIARELAQKMAYCLREAGAISAKGRRGRSRLYELAQSFCPRA